MEKNRLEHMLTSPDKGVRETQGARGALSRLFRTILYDLNIGGMRWAGLMIDYLRDPRNQIPDNKRDQAYARSALNKDLQGEHQTWRVFMKGMRFYKFKKIEISIKAYHDDGRTITEHSTTVDFATEVDSDLEREHPALAGLNALDENDSE